MNPRAGSTSTQFRPFAKCILYISLVISLMSGTQSFSQALCPLGSTPRTVTICKPVAETSYNSPIRVLAGATHTQAVYRMQVYLDGVKVYEQNGAAADTNIIVVPGMHRLTVQGVDALGTFKQSIYVTVRNRLYPRFAYLVNGNDQTTSAFTIEAESGFMRHNGYMPSGVSPSGVAETWRGYVYVSGGSSGKLYAFKRSTNGRLAEVPGSPYGCGANCSGLAVDSTGRFLYAVDSETDTVRGFSISPTTGSLLPVGGSPFAAGDKPSSVAVSVRGIVFVTNESSGTVSVYALNSTTGTLTPTPGSPFKTGSAPRAAVVDPFGSRLYVANYGSGNIATFKVANTGALSPLTASVAPVKAPSGIAMYPSGGFVFVSSLSENSVSVYKIKYDGALLSAGTIATGSAPSAVAVDVQGKYLLVAHSHSPYDLWTYKINLTTGAPTYLRKIRTRGSGVALAVSSGQTPLTIDPGFLYVGTSDQVTKTGKVFALEIGATTGALTSIAGSPFAHSTGVTTLSSHPSGKMLYAPGVEPQMYTGLIGQYAVNPGTGVLTNAGNWSHSPELQSPNMVVESSGRFAYATSPAHEAAEQGFWGWSIGSNLKLGSWLWYGADVLEPYIYLEPTGKFAYLLGSVIKINITSGDLYNAKEEGHEYASMIADPTGRFMFASVTASNEVKAYAVNASSGSLTEVGTALSTGAGPESITVDPYGRFVYIANKNSNDVSAYRVNRGNGALTSIGTFPSGTSPIGITTDAAGRYLFVLNQVSLDVSAYRVDQVTGRLSAVSGSPFHLAASGAATSVVNIGKLR